MSRRLTSIVIALFFLLSVPPVFADSFSDIRTQVRRHAKDTGSTLQRYSDDFINDLINESQKDAVNRTWCIMDVSTEAMTARTTYYSLQSDVIAITQVNYTDSNGDITILTERMERSMRQENPDLESDTGEPTEYFLRQSTMGVNALEIGIRPVPTSVSGDLLTYYFYAQASDLSSDTDIPFEGLSHLVGYHQILSYYAAARLYLIEGNLDRAAGYNALYEAGITIMKDRIGEAPNFNSSFKTNLRTR